MSPLDPIELQVVSGALRAACEEMGAVLIRSAHSANIKERRDASTALFDPDGQMVMQAEHIPVHLGAMPAAVAAVVHEDHEPGVSWMLNDPFAGGTHLPDITVITPVFAAQGQPDLAGATSSGSRHRRDLRPGALIGFAASRAHHADVGGRVPGSMPADSCTLAEEGVVIAPCAVTANGIEQLVARMRQPAERRADLRAQLAANRMGAVRLGELAARVGTQRLREATDAVLDYAERRTRACLGALEDGVRNAEDVLEAIAGDLPLRLRATVAGERLILDFAGSALQHEGNLNCPLAVTRSACYFAVRVLTDPDIPASAGAYRPVEVLVPEGSLLNAVPTAMGAPAVAAGNVETSSRVADLVLKAFGRPLGQGTMNNLTLGSHGFSYYETLGGGQGACPDADGPSGVHVAMSNTLNTPIEALEREFPLRVTRYALRRGSGGDGVHRGGDGVIRELEALSEMSFSLIGERRRHPPPGAEGGEAGSCGRDLLDGCELPGKVTGTLRQGQRLRIETPGGGGFGHMPEQSPDVSEQSGPPEPSRPPEPHKQNGPPEPSRLRERIGFLGLGIMGSRMAANVRRAGFPLTVWTHTPGKAERWAAEHDAVAVGSPGEVARVSDVVVSMVVDGDQVTSVLLGEEGVAQAAAPGLLCVDMSTIAPTDTRRIGAALRECGVRMLDAPVTGSSPRAEDGTLTIMVGGPAEDFVRARPLLEQMGELIVHVGELGQGAMLKLINNALGAANAAALAEALLLAKATGVDLDAFEQVCGAGSGGSTQLTLKAKPMRAHDYTTLFKTAHLLKDVRLCLEEAQATGVPFPAAGHARDLLTATMGRGHAEHDYAALIEAAEGLSGLRL
jgi:N-methylhydantoinase B